MKKYIIIITVLVLAVGFIPIPRGTLNDGGTRVYQAGTYKIVKWHKLVAETVDNGDGTQTAGIHGVYSRTAVYGWGDFSKSLSELYRLERERDDYNEYLIPEG